MKPTKLSKPRTHTGALILKTKHDNPNLTTREIAAIANCTHTNVIETLRRYGVDTSHLNEYKKHRADILAGIQHRMLESITDADIKTAPLAARMMAFGVAYDKERLESGLSTANLASIHADIASLQDSTSSQGRGGTGQE